MGVKCLIVELLKCLTVEVELWDICWDKISRKNTIIY